MCHYSLSHVSLLYDTFKISFSPDFFFFPAKYRICNNYRVTCSTISVFHKNCLYRENKNLNALLTALSTDNIFMTCVMTRTKNMKVVLAIGLNIRFPYSSEFVC